MVINMYLGDLQERVGKVEQGRLELKYSPRCLVFGPKLISY